MDSSYSIKDKKIGMVGLGHVGLTLGLTLADTGFDVVGVDINPEVYKRLKSGQAHFSEQGLDELLAKHLDKGFRVAESFEGANSCDVYMVTVGTPLNNHLEPDYGFLESAASDLANIVKKGDLIVLRSTVPLGTTRNYFYPRLLEGSGLTEGEVLIAFAPERTVEGNALYELRALPQIVGGLDEASTTLASSIFGTLTEHIVKLPTLEEAEIVKLINNSYREVIFSFANEVSILARSYGIDTKRVIQAANEGYARSNIPLPSPGVGGYCLTKDGFLLASAAKEKRIPLHIIPKTRQVSSEMLHSLANEIQHYIKTYKGDHAVPKIAILGFAFKGNPATSDMRGSMTITLIKRLGTLPLKVEIIGYDPLVSKEKIRETGAIPMSSIEEAIKDADVVVIMNNHQEFKRVGEALLSRVLHKPVLLQDTWSLVDKESIERSEHITHRTL